MVRSPLNPYTKAKVLLARLSQALLFSRRSILIASLIAATLVTGAKKLGGLQRFELFVFDSQVRLQPSLGDDQRLVIVGLTESDIQRYGFPLSDQRVATLLEIIQQHQPKVVGLDIYRSITHPPGRSSLEKQLAADNLIAITNVGSDRQVGEVPPPPEVPWERIGFNDLSIDPDGVIRRGLIFVSHPQKSYYSFALRVALKALPESEAALRYDERAVYVNDRPIYRLRDRSGGYQTIDSRGFQSLLRYRSSHTPAEQISIQEILAGDFEPSQLRDKIVLIGSVAPSLKDEFYTPYSASRVNSFTMSGVVIHAQMISQILDIAEGKSAQYRFLPEWGEFVWLIAWAVLTSVCTWKVRRLEMLVLAGFGLVLPLFSASWIGLTQLVWLPLFEPLLCIFVAGSIVITQKLVYRSTYDSLTDLPGREIFLLHIRRALNSQNSGPTIVAFLDIDRFQIINKSIGHHAGDRVLIAIARRLLKTLGERAQIARVGGDEFAILFTNSSQKSAKVLLDQMRLALSSPLMLGKHRLSVTASVGLAITNAKYSQTPEDLLRDAHTAMYRAKALNEAQYQVFSNDMREEAIARLDLESDLIRALEKDEFLLFYQPIVDIQTGKVSGFEALIRWRRQQKDIVSPDKFIPIIEETGMIIPLGEWVIRTACTQIKSWRSQFPDQDLHMSINLSRRQFDQPDLFQILEQLLSDLDLPGDCIQLEITESMIMRDVETAHTLISELKTLGIQIAIDDFGTGYSSLSHLHRFPTDTLKIDRSFINAMENSSEDREIVQTIISLGHKLNMTLVAEGIANSQQLMFLKTAHCHTGQGYFFAKPLSVEAATALLSGQATWLKLSP